MKKILLIEDNHEMRDNTAEILELASYDVLTAENGKSGVDLAKKGNPDLIVCDVMMPELDGYGVLYMLGKNPATASIPFIFLTAKAERGDFRKGMSLGADDYLTKPFEEMELLNAIEGRLKKSETLKAEFSRNIEGIQQFYDSARSLSDLSKLSENRKCRNYKKKETIFYEGDMPTGLYFINKGKVKTYKMNKEGKEYITGLFKEGDFFGYMPMLDGSNYTESASTLEESELFKIPKEDFVALINSNREVSHKFIKMLANDIHEKEDQLLNLAYNTVRKRVAEALLLLQKRYKAEKQEQFSMAISRDDLASIVGTATESVIRTLSDFKDEKLIDIKGSSITILNQEKLFKIW
jgi:CRP-like cAMP-binding protein